MGSYKTDLVSVLRLRSESGQMVAILICVDHVNSSSGGPLKSDMP